MQEFIIHVVSTGHELARVQAENVDSAIDWFFSTRERYELSDLPPLVAISPLGTGNEREQERKPPPRALKPPVRNLHVSTLLRKDLRNTIALAICAGMCWFGIESRE